MASTVTAPQGANWGIPFLLLFTFPVWGVMEGLADHDSTVASSLLSIVHVLLMSGLIFWWAWRDTHARGVPFKTGWKFALVLLGIASVPFYLFHHRPPERRWISIGKGVALLVAAFALYLFAYAVMGPPSA